MPEPVTATVPPTSLVRVTSPATKSVTGSLKTTVKSIGEALVGSAWPLAWSMVTVGAVLSTVSAVPLL